jgi:hypothetical protein
MNECVRTYHGTYRRARYATVIITVPGDLNAQARDGFISDAFLFRLA